MDIDKTRSNENIVLVPCKNYSKKFNEIVAPMKAEHEERMRTIRADRFKTFDQHINSSKNDIAFESVFTSDKEFFKNMSKADIKTWAEKSLEFLINDIGIPKQNIIHAEVHLDEETPHLHVVAVPLVKTYNKKRNAEVWSISRKQFLNGKFELCASQDTYNSRMKMSGYKLERGEKGSKKIHTTKAEYIKQEIELAKKELESVKQEVESAKRDVELAKAVRSNYDGEIKAIKSELEAYRTSRVDIKAVESMDIKKSLLGGKITLNERDYNNLLKLAKSGVANRDKIISLVAENKELNEILSRWRNSEYDTRQENNSLRGDFNNLTDKYSKVVKEHKAMFTVCKNHNLIDEVKKELNPEPKKILNHDMDFER